jgi:putative ABC transport system permease protein
VFLAWKELNRTRGRFVLLVAAVALLVFLIFIQQTLQAGLLDSFVGAIRTQSAPVVVMTVDGRRSLQGSVVTPDLETKVAAVPGVGRVGNLGQRNVTVTAGGSLTQAALMGYEEEGLGSPTTVVTGRLPSAAGEVVASEADRAKGFDVGQTVRVEPGGADLTIVGLARGAQLYASPTLQMRYDTYETAVRAANPDATTILPSALALEPAAGTTPEQAAAAVNAAVAEADALTREQLADLSPGVAQVKQSFQVIFLLYGLVVPLVTGLFFLIVTFQKAGSLTLLRAVGIPGRRLVTSLLAQVALVVIAGLALGVVLYAPLTRAQIGSIALQFQTGAVLAWSAGLLVLALASALLSARRVLAIRPIEATTGQGVQR